MPEFDLIERLVRGARGAGDSALVLGVGDDSALIDVPGGSRLAVTTDTLNEGVHFRAAVDPADLGHKALAVSLSDLAAMGATPRWAFLNLSLAEADDGWIDAFGAGFLALAGASGVSLAGGDTTEGPLSVTVTALGLVPPGVALRRAGAEPGDAIVVSGTLGDAALARRRFDAGQAPGPELVRALDRPRPRCALGEALRGVASACIDLSDGLGSDATHLIRASGCGAEIELARLPASPALSALDADERAKLQTGGGDDYELCFTLPSDRVGELDRLARAGGVALTLIGRITAGDSVAWLDADGHACALPAAGYEHFTEPPRTDR